MHSEQNMWKQGSWTGARSTAWQIGQEKASVIEARRFVRGSLSLAGGSCFWDIAWGSGMK